MKQSDFRLFLLLALGFAGLDGILGAVNAVVYNPSWGSIVAILFGAWMLFTLPGIQRWIGALIIADLGSGAVIFYAFGMARARLLHFAFAICWLTLAYFFRQRSSVATRENG
ncbi:MAG TPA: hypothetical protein VKH81_08420 [Candidatus Angelobacter sp.]|nr:hypothetical protein [Candidatus Angelobacter sp.]